MFPTLYWKDRFWRIDVHERGQTFVVVRTYGKTTGKQTKSEKVITSGKNAGKKNETTPKEQAYNEARSLWVKQQTRSNYSVDVDNQVTKPQAMLAQKFIPSTAKFPCHLQPKLDGVRLLVYMRGGVVHMDSRTGKSMENNPLLSVIRDECRSMLENESVCLDGELYQHGSTFEDIVSMCRTKKTTCQSDSDPTMEYHVYDVVSQEPFERRYALLNDKIFTNHVKRVPCTSVHDIEQFYDIHSEYISNGYEGTMVRDPNGLYESKRSKYLQKHKDFEEQEFVIVDAKEGQGNDEGTIVCECIIPSSNTTFWVRPRGDRALRTDMYNNKHRLIGEKMTVLFQNWTVAGIPRFPVGKCIRNYE